MKFPVLVFVTVIWQFLSIDVFGQDTEHNFEMSPQTTNCDSLDLSNLSEEEKIGIIEEASFRLHQDFKFNRLSGFQAAWYYSCDNHSGFIIAKIDNHKRLFENVKTEIWNQFMSSGDFLKFIQDNFE